MFCKYKFGFVDINRRIRTRLNSFFAHSTEGCFMAQTKVIRDVLYTNIMDLVENECFVEARGSVSLPFFGLRMGGEGGQLEGEDITKN